MQTGLKRTLASLVSIAVSFALGMIVGVTGSKGGASEPEPEETSVKARGAIAETGADERTEILRDRVKDLERQLAEKAAPEATAEKVEPQESPRRGAWPSSEEMRANFEKFRKEHPEEFKRMEEGRRDFMRRRQERAQRQVEFLSSVDTSKMSEADRKNHESLMRLIAKRQEFENAMTPEAMMNATDEERRETFEAMRETENAIREQYAKERQALLRQTAEELGFTGDDASAVVDTIGEIYEATSGDRGGFGGHRGHRGPGGRRGPDGATR